MRKIKNKRKAKMIRIRKEKKLIRIRNIYRKNLQYKGEEEGEQKKREEK